MAFHPEQRNLPEFLVSSQTGGEVAITIALLGSAHQIETTPEGEEGQRVYEAARQLVYAAIAEHVMPTEWLLNKRHLAVDGEFLVTVDVSEHPKLRSTIGSMRPQFAADAGEMFEVLQHVPVAVETDPTTPAGTLSASLNEVPVSHGIFQITRMAAQDDGVVQFWVREVPPTDGIHRLLADATVFSVK